MVLVMRILRLSHIPRRCASSTSSTPGESAQTPNNQIHVEYTEREKRLYPQVKQEITSEGYPLLKFAPRKRNIFANRARREVRARAYKLKSREQEMDPEQDWPSVWPTPKTFSPSAVPLPIRQSFEEKGRVPIGKYANTELLKITNFLHLTPPAVERHCKALQKFCTQWPEGLDTDEEVRQHFPVTIVTRDFVHAGPSIRDERSRCVELRVNVDDLKLEGEDREKFDLLVRDRLNEKTNMVTIKTDACPSKVQNEDYANYLLTACYYESQNHEEWEKEKPEEFKKDIDLDEYRKGVEKSLGLA